MGNIIKTQDSRRTFIDVLIELAQKDPMVCLVVPDVGFLYIEEFQKRFPDRFFNFGTTEASTIMIVTGMAKVGLKPFVYSMINFVLFHSAAVRNGIVCHNVPVTLLGVKGSSGYKFLGFSHNLLHDKEDFNFCDNIRLKWYNPQTNEEVRQAVFEAYHSGKPNYIRL